MTLVSFVSFVAACIPKGRRCVQNDLLDDVERKFADTGTTELLHDPVTMQSLRRREI